MSGPFSSLCCFNYPLVSPSTSPCSLSSDSLVVLLVVRPLLPAELRSQMSTAQHGRRLAYAYGLPQVSAVQFSGRS